MHLRTIVLSTLAAIAAPITAFSAPIDELDRFAGTWQSEGTFVDGPYSKAGVSTASTTCAWSNDRSFMICQQSVLTSGKRSSDLGIYTYDDASSAYRFYNVSSARTTSTTITVSGNTITYPFSFTDNGKNVTIRTLNIWKNAGLYTWRAEYTTDGGATWTPMGSGSSKKTP